MVTIPRRLIRYLGCLLPVACLIGFISLVVYQALVHQRHARWYRDVEYCILRLAEKQPEGVSPAQWAFSTFWTWQLHDNFGGYAQFDHGVRDRFLVEFDRRLDRRVDLSTIDWIWDQYVEYARARSFSQEYRPTDPERLRELSEGIDLNWWHDDLNRRRAVGGQSEW